jgi:hypothetical protein
MYKINVYTTQQCFARNSCIYSLHDIRTCTTRSKLGRKTDSDGINHFVSQATTSRVTWFDKKSIVLTSVLSSSIVQPNDERNKLKTSKTKITYLQKLIKTLLLLYLYEYPAWFKDGIAMKSVTKPPGSGHFKEVVWKPPPPSFPLPSSSALYTVSSYKRPSQEDPPPPSEYMLRINIS